jgi:Na+/H+-dicarboxylate symporter
MDIHILDIVMYFVVIGVFWFLADKFGNGKYTNDLGGLIGLFWAAVITIAYIIAFGVYDWNWIDIFNGINPSDWFHFKL